MGKKFPTVSLSLVLLLLAGLHLSLGVAQGDSSDDNPYASHGSHNSVSRFGLQFQRFKGGGTDTGTQGMLLGVRDSEYIYRGFSMGYELNVGTPKDGSIVNNNLFYTGLLLGYDKAFAKVFNYDIGVLVGYGYGQSNALNISGQSFVLQPSAGLGFILISGYRVTFEGSYLYTPMTSGFSGLMFGIRFERKIESSPGKPIDY